MDLQKFREDLKEFMRVKGYSKTQIEQVASTRDTVEMRFVFYKGFNDL